MQPVKLNDIQNSEDGTQSSPSPASIIVGTVLCAGAGYLAASKVFDAKPATALWTGFGGAVFFLFSRIGNYVRQ